MMVLVTYDVGTDTPEGRSRLRRVSKVCQNHGIRVQKSVFECRVSPAERVILEDELRGILDPEVDSIRIYDLGNMAPTKIIHLGVKKPIDLEGTLIF